QGDFEQAASLIQKGLNYNLECQDKRGVAANLAAVAAMMAAQGRARDAIRIYGAVDALLESIHSRLAPLDRELNEPTLNKLHDQVDRTMFADIFAEGRTMTMEQAIAKALRT